jgi:hypothetical protein
MRKALLMIPVHLHFAWASLCETDSQLCPNDIKFRLWELLITDNFFKYDEKQKVRLAKIRKFPGKHLI